ncbi:DUF7694 domain-containing protein [Luteimonas saliphila]|uniref:DUF7694 domain-containing protein n=1 Tax=Luteimonas saliphila TaxID=2804919 RepID=UPI00192DE4A9|nr:hypothetical protein [Luteimonas saliphila]
MAEGIHASRQQRKALERANRDWPERLAEIPRGSLPPHQSEKFVRALRSRQFLVQEFAEPGDIIRLSASRTTLRGDGRWDDGISWDELQRLKAEAGYGDRFAVEVYPADVDVVNVGNLRHLWILPAAPPFAWRRE